MGERVRGPAVRGRLLVGVLGALFVVVMHWLRFEGPIGSYDVVMAILTLVVVHSAVRMWWVSLEFTADGIVVRNVLRSHRLRWEQVVDAWSTQGTRWIPERVYLRLDTGHVVHVDASVEGRHDHFAWHLAQDLRARLSVPR